MDIEKKQIEALNFIKNDFFTKNTFLNDLSHSSFFYYALWGRSIGFEKLKLKLFGKKKILSFLNIYLKDLLSILKNYEYNFSNLQNFKKYEILVFSSASKTDFKSDGSYVDRYFKINSKDFYSIKFYLDYTDEELPVKIDKNIILFKLTKSSLIKGIIFFLKNLFNKIKKFKEINKIIYSISSQSLRAENLFEKVLINEDLKSIKKIIFPYEGQPFQQYMISESKKINKNLQTIGYDHSTPHSLPFHLYYRGGSPDNLYVTGQSQIDHMVNNQNWPKNKVKLIPSLRYQDINENEFNDKIFLPYQIFNEKVIIKELESFLKNQNNHSLNKLDVKTHPVAASAIAQKKIKIAIEMLLDKYSQKFTIDENLKKTSIFIGPTTGVIVALEKNLNVIHVCFEPIFDAYTTKMWPNLRVNKISENILEYTLVKKNSFILIKKDPNLFNNYFIN